MDAPWDDDPNDQLTIPGTGFESPEPPFYPPNITRMNGLTLGELLNTVDADPIVPGITLNGKKLRQSDIDRLCPEPPEGSMTPDEIERWHTSPRYRFDRTRRNG